MWSKAWYHRIIDFFDFIQLTQCTTSTQYNLTGEEEEKGGQGSGPGGDKVLDLTDQDLVNLRRTLYLTIMSSVSFEECAHKITRLKIPDGYELELCNMLGASLAVYVYMHTQKS
jgi:MA3 domain